MMRTTKITKSLVNKRELLFLRNVIIFTISSFGGAQTHIALLQALFVKRSSFVSQDELMELFALSQVLPGPASTQTLIGIAYKAGGYKIAVITIILWLAPSAIVMYLVATGLSFFNTGSKFSSALWVVEPIVIAIVAHAAVLLSAKIIKDRVSFFLAIGAAIATLILRNAYVFPLCIIIGGIISSAMQAQSEEALIRQSLFSNINRNKVLYFISFLVVFALLGTIINTTSPFSLPIRLFENFYRNGMFVFGGGQVLVPLMFTEFVQMKHYLTAQQFLAGYGVQQLLPGPTFSFTSYLGALSMKSFGYNNWGQAAGALIGVIGINLPGIILILFIVPFWAQLKKINTIKKSLTGVNAVCIGFIAAAAVLMFIPLGFHIIPFGVMITAFLLLTYTRIGPPVILLCGMAAAILLGHFYNLPVSV